MGDVRPSRPTQTLALMTKLAEVFALKRQGLNLRAGAAVVTVMLVPLIVLGALHRERYWLSVSFGTLFVGLCDPGGDYAYRLPRMAVFALAGAPLTALGFGLGGRAWGLAGFGLGGGAWGLVVLAVIVMLLADQIRKHTTTAAPRSP